MAGPLCAEGGVCIFRVLFLEDPGPEGQDMSPQRQEEPSLMSVSVLTMAGMEPALEAEGGGGKRRGFSQLILPISSQNLPQTHFLCLGLSPTYPVNAGGSFQKGRGL